MFGPKCSIMCTMLAHQFYHLFIIIIISFVREIAEAIVHNAHKFL